MRGILINPVNRTITEIDVKPGLQGLYAALRADAAFSGTVELVRVTDAVDLWIDEEGNLGADRPVFNFGHQPVAGAALILGNDGEGDSEGLPDYVTLQRASHVITWTNKVTTGDCEQTTTEETPDGFVIRVGAPIHEDRDGADAQ